MIKHAMCNVGREKIKQTEHSLKNVQASIIPVLNVQIQQSPISMNLICNAEFKLLKMSMAHTLDTIQINKHIGYLTLSACQYSETVMHVLFNLLRN
jgi:hypothetical protein